jgi:hypothetical protein
LTNPKKHAHELIERLAPNQAAAVAGLLEAMLDPVARAIATAPVDEEPLTAEDQRALDEAREWSRHHKGIPHEQVLAELDLTQEDIDRHRGPA